MKGDGSAMNRQAIRLHVLAAISVLAAFAVHFMHASALVSFLFSAWAIIVLAKLIGQGTEALAIRFGSAIGALLGATFGNSVELILSIIALKDGLDQVVKASIIGSFLANLLLTLGACMIVGGMRKPVQHFNRARAGRNSVMLFVAVTGLTIASIDSYRHSVVHHFGGLSMGIAIVFLFVYVLGFVFSMFTHRIFLAPIEEMEESGAGYYNSPGIAALILVLATVLVAMISANLVDTVTPIAALAHLSPSFIGLIFFPIIGMAPEFFSATMLAVRDQMDGSIEITVGSSLQMALFVAPILVLLGTAFGRPLTLVFPTTDVVSVFLSTILVTLVSLDGESHWFEGVMMVAAYLIFGLLFFFQ